MPRTRIPSPLPARTRPKRGPDELLVPKRTPRGRKAEVVRLQWLDGAGELQYEELTPAQSWPYLEKE